MLYVDVPPVGVPPDVPADTIAIDRIGGFRLATEHLIQLGHRRIGLLASYTALGRREGYTQAMEAAGLDYSAIALGDRAGVKAPPIRACLEQLLSTHPDLTALVGSTDEWAQEIIHHLAQMGLRVPDDMSLASYSNEPWTQWTLPSLTTLDQGTEALCAHTLATMRRRLEGSDEPHTHRMIVPKLIVRDSTAPPRGS